MKGSERPKKAQKKQKTLKQRRIEKRVASEEIRFQPTMVGGGRRSRRSGLLAPGPSIAAEHAMIRPSARSE
jgi:hypothetical protein